MKLKIFIITLICIIIPVDVSALYTVEHLTKTDDIKIGEYEKYEDAYKVMDDYKSTSADVAVIKENNKIINAKYAIARLKYDHNFPTAENSNNEHRIFLTNTSTSVFTTIHAAYGNDTAFISYDPYAKAAATSGRVQIKISGLVGWVNAPYVDIIPISRLSKSGFVASKGSDWFKEIGNNKIETTSYTPINIRSKNSTGGAVLGTAGRGNTYTYTNKTNNQGFTWYEIELSSSLGTYYEVDSNGNLLHKFATHASQGTTNLGKAPAYLNKNIKYYSFDGNYFYTSIQTMLKDYKDNDYQRAVNSLSPHYSYYLYLSNHSKTKYTEDDFNLLISSKNLVGDKTLPNYSAMFEQGKSFIESQNTHGVNALLTFSAAVNESDYGRSTIAKNKNNLFGHGASGTNVYEAATTFASPHESIMTHASMTGKEYNNPSDHRYFGGHYGNKNSGMNVLYATDPYWGEKMASNAYNSDKTFGLQEFDGNTLGVTKKLNVNVKKKPTYNSDTIYTLKNKSYSVKDIPLTVIDKIKYEDKYWYKVYTDPSLDDNQNINLNINYDFNKSYGYINENELYVSNTQPVITAYDKIVNVGDTNIDLFKDVSAYDKENGDLTEFIEISSTSEDVKINVPGEYNITFTVKDKSQFSVSKTIKVTVIGDLKPIIEAQDKTLTQFKEYDLKENVKVTDKTDGDLLDKVEIITDLDINVPGNYKVTYKIKNSLNKETTKEINVTVLENEKPVITATNKEIKFESIFNPLDGVTAIDKEDGKLEVKLVSSTVDTSKEGKYIVVYSATDKDNQKTIKTTEVEVVKDELLEKDGLYYVHYIKDVNNKLSIKGYNAITGIDNNLDEDIKYYIEFVDVETLEVKFTQQATRITDKNQIDIPVFSMDKKDYTYSWFNYEFDLANIENGNYRLYIVSKTDKYYSRSLISNKMFAPQDTNFKGEKVVTTRNNYTYQSAPVEFSIRDTEIAPKTTKIYTYNQYDQYLDMNFIDNKLYLKGTSYSYNMNLSENKNVKRNIIFENKKTHQKEIYSLNVVKGPYVPVLPVTDNLSKTYAWYDTNVDITNLEEGNYNIYISNISNISDYSEFKDYFNRDITKIKLDTDTKEFSFKLNMFNNIELIVKNK